MVTDATPTPVALIPADIASPDGALSLDVATFLADPLLHGAWLWQANCVRCHGEYGADRVGEVLKPKALRDKITGADKQGCATAWALTKGGPLSLAEIKDLVAYIGAWEEAGAPPDLAPLLPIPAPTSRPTPTPVTTRQATVVTPIPSHDPGLVAALQESPVYEGAWLYAENCVICHLGYSSARQAALNDDATILDLVTHGKPATSMPAFGMLVGGQLRRAQIDSIIAYMRAWEDFGREPELPQEIAAELARRTTIAASLPTVAGAPASLAPPAAPRVVASAIAPPAPSRSAGADPGLWRIFLMLAAIGATTGVGIFAFAVVCTAIVPPKRPPDDRG